MTKHIHTLARQLQPAMIAGDPPAVIREAWASIVRWHEVGEPIYRLTTEDIESAKAGLPLDHPLATAPIVAKGMLYIIEREHWLLLARHDEREPYPIAEDSPYRAYDAPTLTYASMVEDTLASGSINLRDSPTPRQLRIYPGSVMVELGARPLDRQEVAIEIARLSMCLPHFYRL